MKTFVAAIAVLSISIFTMPSLANADLIFYTVEVPSMDLDEPNEVFLPMFDPAFGTLTAVSVEFVGEGEVGYEVLQDFDGDGGSAFALMFGEFTVQVGTGPIGNTIDLTGADFYDYEDFWSVPVFGLSEDFSVNPDTLDLFIAQSPNDEFGTEILFNDFDVFADDGDDVSPEYGFFYEGEFTVYYDFNPVPEPNSLLILGLFSISLVRTRRRSA